MSDHSKKGSWYYRVCPGQPVDLVWLRAGSPQQRVARAAPQVTPLDLLQRARGLLRVNEPVVLTAPPRRSSAIVNLPTWFWLAPGQWSQRVSRTVRAGQVWVRASVHPTAMVIEPGDGASVACTDGGRAWSATEGTGTGAGACTHRYLRSSGFSPGGAFPVQVTVRWGGTWTGSDGTGGALPALSRSTTFPLKVVQSRAQLVSG